MPRRGCRTLRCTGGGDDDEQFNDDDEDDDDDENGDDDGDGHDDDNEDSISGGCWRYERRTSGVDAGDKKFMN